MHTYKICNSQKNFLGMMRSWPLAPMGVRSEVSRKADSPVGLTVVIVTASPKLGSLKHSHVLLEQGLMAGGVVTEAGLCWDV